MSLNDSDMRFDGEYFKTGSARTKSSSAVAIPSDEGDKVEFGVVVQSSPAHLYKLLRNLLSYVEFIPNLESVQEIQPGRFHWVLKGAGQKPLAWNIELMTEKENQLLAWRSVDPADVASAGSIRLKKLSDGRGTELKVSLKYDVPNENLKSSFQKLFGESAAAEVRTSVRRFKALVETGEIPSTDGQPRGGFPGGASDPKNSYKVQAGREGTH